VTKARLRIDEMDSRTLEREARSGKLLILPIGALEAHGPHLPLAADLIQAERTALELAPRVDGLVAPGLPYGVCPGTRVFPGTVSHTPTTLAAEVEELLDDFHRFGFRRVLILSGHGALGHMAAIRHGAERATHRHHDLAVAALCDYEFVYELRGKEAPASDGHGGLLETSRVLALAPELVGPERPVVEFKVPKFQVREPTPDQWSESVMGDTRKASAALGQRIQRHVLSRLEETVRAALPVEPRRKGGGT
jgi:creatinine amidohydrolase